MKAMQSFLMFFYILDQCYEQCPENDMGVFLGVVSPELWEDGKPMDKAVYNDWQDQNEVALLNNKNIKNATINFLKYYQTKSGLNFSKTISIIQNTANEEMIDNAINRTNMMYLKHGYDD